MRRRFDLQASLAKPPIGLRCIHSGGFREFGDLPFSVAADLFIPAGGRPETINEGNWKRFLLPDGSPSSRVIVEGANSFITPAARLELQKKDVVLMRDASANKCGVISSS